MASDAKPTHSIYALIVRKPGVSFEFFKDYYENSHIPWVNKLISGDERISTWTRNYLQRSKTEVESLQGYGNDTPGTWDFDVITHIVPKSQAAFEEIWEKFKEVGEAIAKDEMNFSDRERSKVYFVEDVQGGF
jgi:hypothetical protein